VSAIALASLVEPAADILAGKGPQQGEGDEPPAEAPLDPEIDDDRDGDVDVKIPRQREFPAILPQVAERYVEGDRNKDESDKREKITLCVHSRIVGFYGVFVNADIRPDT
jgi:hypothetical protein